MENPESPPVGPPPPDFFVEKEKFITEHFEENLINLNGHILRELRDLRNVEPKKALEVSADIVKVSELLLEIGKSDQIDGKIRARSVMLGYFVAATVIAESIFQQEQMNQVFGMLQMIESIASEKEKPN